MRFIASGVVLAAFVVLAGFGQSVRAEESGAPTAEEISARMMAKNAERQAGLANYSSDRTYRVEYKGTGGQHKGEIEVHAEYLGAGKKRLTVMTETGSKLICERVLRKMVEGEQEASDKANQMQMMLSPANYTMDVVGQETVDGVRAWVLQVAPKVDNKFTYRGRVWVSEDDYAVVRVLGEPAKNPSFWINHASFDWKYGRHGAFWLPEKSVAVSHVRIGGEAKLTIEYGEYHVAGAETKTAQLVPVR